MALDIEPLHSSICEMLKKHESKSVIDQKLTSLYNPTGSRHLEDMDQLRYYDTMAKCYGVHYGHEDFCFVCNPPYCHFIPLLTAVHERKIDLLHLLEHPDRQGYGIFKDDQIGMDRYTSAFDIVMERDDAEILPLLMPEYTLELGPLFHLAIRHKAKKCFQYLMENYESIEKGRWDDFSTLKHVPTPFLLAMLSRVLEYAFNNLGYVTQLRRESAMHIFSYLEASDDVISKCNTTFLSEEKSDIIKSLLSTDAMRSFYNDNIDQLSVDGVMNALGEKIMPYLHFTENHPDPLELHSEVILQSCKILLDQITAQPVDGDGGFRSVFRKCFDTFCLVGSRLILAWRPSDADFFALRIGNNLTKLFLHYVMQCPEGTLRSRCVIDVNFVNYQMLGVERIDEVTQNETINTSRTFGGIHAAIVATYGCNDMKKVLSWRHLFWINQYPPFADMCSDLRSILPHQYYELYRKHQEEKKQELWELETSNRYVERQHSLLRAAVANNCVPACRSLLHLCRARLYELVPERRMIVYVSQFPLPKSLKLYLTLGVEPIA